MRTLLSLAVAPLLTGGALAQHAEILTFEGPVQFGGVYHVAAGYFEPAPAPSYLGGTDAIYDNTCVPTVSYSATLNGSVLLDDGRLPSTTSPAPNAGTFNRYRVKSFVFAYATRELQVSSGGPGASITISFWQDYDACQSLASAGSPQASFPLTGLPGSATQGTLAAWSVVVDLTGVEFDLLADADGDYDASLGLDTFGWSFSPSGQLGTTTATVGGPIIAPNPGSSPPPCAIGASTYYNSPGSASGTGLDNQSAFRREGAGGQSTGCLFFGAPPAPWGGFFLEVNADLTDCNANALPDAYDISSGGSADCNANGVPDECDIASATSTDLNGNGIPDECECGVAAASCGAGTSVNGCTPALTWTGTPSASAIAGFDVTATGMDGQRNGGFFYGIAYGPIQIGTGSSFFCGPQPRQRIGPFGSTGGTIGACDGSRMRDVNDWLANHPTQLGGPFAFGSILYIQGWNRDGGNPSNGLNVTDGIAVTLCP
jgi:hypothetical protein